LNLECAFGDQTAPRAHALLCAAPVKTLRSINDLAIAGLERIPQKLTDFCDQNSLQLSDLARFLIGRFERKTR
jgi:hypothetical protein